MHRSKWGIKKAGMAILLLTLIVTDLSFVYAAAPEGEAAAGEESSMDASGTPDQSEIPKQSDAVQEQPPVTEQPDQSEIPKQSDAIQEQPPVTEQPDAAMPGESEIPEQPQAVQPPETPATDGIVIDGVFSDWVGYELAYANKNGMAQVSLVSDGTNIYIRVVEDGSFDRCFPHGGAPIGLTSNMGKNLWLNSEVHGENEDTTLTFTGIEGGFAECAKIEGIYNWEIIIPLSELWTDVTYVSQISLIWPDDYSEITNISNPSYVDRENSDPDGDLDVGTGIEIDGYYKDWDGIPHMEITYGGNNGSANHHGALYVDGENLYVHYKMNRLYTSYIQIQYMTLSINGVEFKLQVLPINGDGSINWDAANKSLQNGIHTTYGVFLSEAPNGESYYSNLNGNAAITIFDSNHSIETPGDEVEFFLSMKRLEKLTGIEASGMREIKLHNANIGHEWLVCVGSSSGPLIGIAISIVAAAGFYVIWTRSKKKKGTKI